ncbi:CcmD family protein [Oscillatoria amoena NRMC-F 0135]|jgi:CcmD family protein|nr:CcmD family protein [Oscillatoria amoena NRMC-F 0135]
MNKRIITLVLFLLSALTTFGQNEATVAGDDKIFVVVGVLTVIFVGLAVYLFSIDRKITRLEKQKKETKV